MGRALKKTRKSQLSPLDEVAAELPDGRDFIVSCVRRLSFNDDRYETWMATYDADPNLPLDDYCKAAEVDPSTLLGDCVEIAYRWGESVTALAASAVATKRVKAVIERSYIEGAKPQGFEDRHALLQRHGVHPTPKGNVINLNQNQGMSVAIPPPNDFEDQTKEIDDILREPLQLAESDDDYLDADLEEEEEEVPVVLQRTLEKEDTSD